MTARSGAGRGRRGSSCRFLQVVTTTPGRADADRIARWLVEQRLAACVQVQGPITSRYRWRGRVECAREWRCLVKISAGRYAKVEATIRALHPYEVPEIVAVPIVRGGADYLEWLGCAVGRVRACRKARRKPGRPVLRQT
jgi:periplasmic divalent cation tolerance protein